MNLHLEVLASHDVTLVYCRGRIVYREEASALSEKVAELLPATKRLILDLNGVEMIDSAGLGELVLLYLWAQAAGCDVKLARPPANISRLLELTNLSSVFDILPAVESTELRRHQVA